MCLTCGCMDAHLEMGEANITYEDVKRAADENGRSVAETLEIMTSTEAEGPRPAPAGVRPTGGGALLTSRPITAGCRLGLAAVSGIPRSSARDEISRPGSGAGGRR